MSHLSSKQSPPNSFGIARYTKLRLERARGKPPGPPKAAPGRLRRPPPRPTGARPRTPPPRQPGGASAPPPAPRRRAPRKRGRGGRMPPRAPPRSGQGRGRGSAPPCEGVVESPLAGAIPESNPPERPEQGKGRREHALSSTLFPSLLSGSAAASIPHSANEGYAPVVAECSIDPTTLPRKHRPHCRDGAHGRASH